MSPASSSPAPLPQTLSTGRSSSTEARAAPVVVFPIPISPALNQEITCSLPHFAGPDPVNVFDHPDVHRTDLNSCPACHEADSGLPLHHVSRHRSCDRGISLRDTFIYNPVIRAEYIQRGRREFNIGRPLHPCNVRNDLLQVSETVQRLGNGIPSCPGFLRSAPVPGCDLVFPYLQSFHRFRPFLQAFTKPRTASGPEGSHRCVNPAYSESFTMPPRQHLLPSGFPHRTSCLCESDT